MATTRAPAVVHDRTRLRRRPHSWLLSAGALLLLLAMSAAPASAHADRISGACCSPADGEALTEAPIEVRMIFTEKVDPGGSWLEVRNAATGERVDACDTKVVSQDPPTMVVHLRPLADGVYKTTWTTLSGSDGHAKTGELGFSVGSFQTAAGPAHGAEQIPFPQAASRGVLFTGLALGLGAAMLLAFVPALPRRTVGNALLAGALLHLVGVGMLLATTAQASPVVDGCQSRVNLGRFLGTDVGQHLFVRLITAVAAVAVLLPPFFLRRAPLLQLAGGGVLMVAAAAESSGLAHAAEAGLAGIVVDSIHLLAAASWVGGLMVFAWQLRRWSKRPETAPPIDDVRHAGLRFGTLAMAALIILLLAGTTDALLIAGPQLRTSLAGTLSSAWGIFLLLKILVVAVMVPLAACNRYVFLENPGAKGLGGLVQRIVAGLAPRATSVQSSGSSRQMAAWVRAEATLGVLVLILAGLLTAVSPPPVAAAAGPVVFEGHGDNLDARLEFASAPVFGSSPSVRLHLQAHNGTPFSTNFNATCQDRCVRLTIVQFNETKIARPLGDGWWEVDPFLFTTPGPTTLSVKVQSPAFFKEEITIRFVVGS